jgi:CubicO group peptidase (beta-lactamase class C family)
MTKRMILLLITIIACGISASFALADEKTDAVDKLFAAWDRTNSPGASLAILKDGKIIYKRGYGMADLEHGVTNKPDTVFRIASTSKQFTAACVALLALRGELDLDACVRDYIPELCEIYQPVTVRHLVHHISGIRDYLTLQDLRGIGDDEYYTPKDVLELLSRQQALNFAPGNELLYSNSGYFLLGEIVRRVSGKTLAEFAKENIFQPLGMADTHFHDDHGRIVPDRATGYSPSGDGFEIDETILDIVGDGAVFTTVEDMYLWDQNFYDNKLVDGLVELILTPGVLNNGDTLDYAFGLGYGEHRGMKIISHGGAFVGFRAQIIRFPDVGFSVVCLCNNGSMNPNELCLKVADIYLQDQFTTKEEGETASAVQKKEPIELPKEKLEALAGRYISEDRAAFWEIRAEEDRLKLIRSDFSIDVYPVSETRFEGEFQGIEITADFESVEMEPAFRFFSGGRERGLYRRFTPPNFTEERLASYTGSYYSRELDMTYVWESEGVELFIRFRNAPDEPLLPVSADEFKWQSTSLKMARDESGAIRGFEMDAGRVRGIRFTKQ